MAYVRISIRCIFYLKKCNFIEYCSIKSLQRSFINAVSGSLIRAPDFKQPKDATRLDLIAMADRVAFYDAEFVMKVRQAYVFIVHFSKVKDQNK